MFHVSRETFRSIIESGKWKVENGYELQNTVVGVDVLDDPFNTLNIVSR